VNDGCHSRQPQDQVHRRLHHTTMAFLSVILAKNTTNFYLQYMWLTCFNIRLISYVTYVTIDAQAILWRLITIHYMEIQSVKNLKQIACQKLSCKSKNTTNNHRLGTRTTVPVGLLRPDRRCWLSAPSAFRQPSTTCSTSLSAQHLRPSGLSICRPHSLELSPGFHRGPDHQCRLFQTFA